MDFTILIKILETQGLPVFLIVVALAFYYYKIYPEQIKRNDDFRQERVIREEEYRKHAEEDRSFQLKELMSLREHIFLQQAKMTDAFVKNTEATVKLTSTLEIMTERIESMDNELSNVYRILGEKRNLIQTVK